MQRSPSPLLYYAIFFLSGISVMLLSVSIPQMHPALPDVEIGHMLAAQFTAQLLGPFLVTKRTGQSLAIGLLISALTGAMMGRSAVPGLPLLFFYGLGMGMVMTSTNLLAGEEALPEDRAPRIEMLNAFWPLGAACAPFCSRFFGAAVTWRAYFFVAATSAVALAVVMLRKKPEPLTHEQQLGAEERSMPRLVRLCLMAALAIGLEASLSNWSPTFAARYIGGGSVPGTVATIFWVGILVSRSAASFLLAKMRWSVFAIASTLLCVTATLVLAASRGWLLYAAVALAAIGIAPIYPVIIARCLKLRGKSFVFVMAGVGSAALPWLVGTLSTHTGSLRVSMLAASVAGVLLLAALVQEARSAARVAVEAR